MKSFWIYVHHVSAKVTAHGSGLEAALQSLADDFSGMVTTQARSNAEALVELHWGPTPVHLQKKLWPCFRTKKTRTWGWGRQRRIEYVGRGTLTILDQEKQTQVWLEAKPAFYRDISYLTLLALIGECLESKGLARVHGLSISRKKTPDWAQGVLLNLRSGLGKSSLAWLAQQDSRCQVFAEEISLFDGQNLKPFPLRMALTSESIQRLEISMKPTGVFQRQGALPKHLFPLPAISQSSATPLHRLLYGTRSQVSRIHSHPGLWIKISAWFDLWLGRDLPQMFEIAVRGSRLSFLSKMAWRRAWLWAEWVFSPRFAHFEMSASPQENWQVLRDFFQWEMHQ